MIARNKNRGFKAWMGWLRTRNRGLEIFANSLLFLSSLLLLIDIAPRDFLPSQRQRVRALAALRANQNILGPVPTGISVRPQTATMKIVSDPDAYQTLVDIIRERSIRVNDVSWKDALGVGYATVSVPVATNKLDAMHPLYVVQMPPDNGDNFVLVPVGQLEDLESWVSQTRQTSTTRFALLLLATGFLLQLLTGAIKPRE
jgi:hypothetical protein